MKPPRKLWRNKEWRLFSVKVKERDKDRCTHCHRTSSEVTLQVHHEVYVPNKAPWEYSLSDCITLCKGCHAREHGLIEPQKGWILISIDDLGGLVGICERKGCNKSIQYEHLTYHPNWGYKAVGSTCIEYLTQADIALSSEVLQIYKKISSFIHRSKWVHGYTKIGKKYLETVYNRSHKIRIYGNNNHYAFQVILKEKGKRSYLFEKSIPSKNKPLEQVKELAFIVLKGKTTESIKEKKLLRELYLNIN